MTSIFRDANENFYLGIILRIYVSFDLCESYAAGPAPISP